MNNELTRQHRIDELKTKIYYAQTPHAALYESNSIYIEILKQELDVALYSQAVTKEFEGKQG